MGSPVLTKVWPLSGLVKNTILQAEKLYPGRTLRAEVELNDELKLVISVYVEEDDVQTNPDPTL